MEYLADMSDTDTQPVPLVEKIKKHSPVKPSKNVEKTRDAVKDCISQVTESREKIKKARQSIAKSRELSKKQAELSKPRKNKD
jgi:hypothetical protein